MTIQYHIVALFCILLLPVIASAQTFEPSATEKYGVEMRATPLIKSLLHGFSCDYIKDGLELTRVTVTKTSQNYYGSLQYSSPNCNVIRADIEIQFALRNGIAHFKKVCLYMPTCMLGKPMDIFNWECIDY